MEPQPLWPMDEKVKCPALSYNSYNEKSHDKTYQRAQLILRQLNINLNIQTVTGRHNFDKTNKRRLGGNKQLGCSTGTVTRTPHGNSRDTIVLNNLPSSWHDYPVAHGDR